MKQVEGLEKLAAEIERNPMTARFRAEEAAETLRKRTAAADQIEALRKLQIDIIPKEEKVSELVARLAVLEEERRTLLLAINEERTSLGRERLDIEGDIRQQEEILLSTYDPCIDEEIAWHRERREILLLKKPDIQVRRDGSNIFTMAKKFVTFSNMGRIREALSYHLACIHELEVMRLKPAFDAERIKVLRKATPDISQLGEVAGESPFPKVGGGPPLKTESQLNYELEKLNEKFQRLIGRR